MEQQLNQVHQDFEKPSELEMKRNQIRNDLAKVQKCKKKVKNGSEKYEDISVKQNLICKQWLAANFQNLLNL